MDLLITMFSILNNFFYKHTYLVIYFLLRAMFVENFLLSKVFPFRCLRWILQFAIFGCPFDDRKLKKGDNNHVLLEAAQRVVQMWSRREFVQSAPLEQQVCILYGICFCVIFLTFSNLFSLFFFYHTSSIYLFFKNNHDSVNGTWEELKSSEIGNFEKYQMLISSHNTQVFLHMHQRDSGEE